jgi:hypothetical protein
VCRCLEAGEKDDSLGEEERRGGGGGDPSNGRRRQKPKLVVPPKLLMAIEKDRSLRERLRKYDLPTKGTRQVRQLSIDANCNCITAILGFSFGMSPTFLHLEDVKTLLGVSRPYPYPSNCVLDHILVFSNVAYCSITLQPYFYI